MTPTPIYDALEELREAIAVAIAPLLQATAAYKDTAGRSKVYWVQAAQVDANKNILVLPYMIYQPQDPGAAVKYIGSLSWSGLIAVRALANTLDAAEDLMRTALPGMATLTATGYSITQSYERPIPPLSGDRWWQCGHIWRIHISA